MKQKSADQAKRIRRRRRKSKHHVFSLWWNLLCGWKMHYHHSANIWGRSPQTMFFVSKALMWIKCVQQKFCEFCIFNRDHVLDDSPQYTPLTNTYSHRQHINNLHQYLSTQHQYLHSLRQQSRCSLPTPMDLNSLHQHLYSLHQHLNNLCTQHQHLQSLPTLCTTTTPMDLTPIQFLKPKNSKNIEFWELKDSKNFLAAKYKFHFLNTFKHIISTLHPTTQTIQHIIMASKAIPQYTLPRVIHEELGVLQQNGKWFV